MARIRISNWWRWQSYRTDRGQPPWIKVHRKLLRNPDWISLTTAQRGQLVNLWMLAADNEGVIVTPKNCDGIDVCASYLMNVLHMDKKPDLQVLLNHGFIENWRHSGVTLASRWRHVDAPEADTETEADTEEKKTLRQSGAKKRARSNGLDAGFVSWYEPYPRKTHKAEAHKAWSKLSESDRSKLIKTSPFWFNYLKTRETDKIPYPATFIRSRCWEELPPKNRVKTPMQQRAEEFGIEYNPENDPDYDLA